MFYYSNQIVIQRSFSDEESRRHHIYVLEILRFALNDKKLLIDYLIHHTEEVSPPNLADIFF